MTRTPALLPSEWRALLRNYLIGTGVFLVALFGLGVCYGRHSGLADGDRLRKQLSAAAVVSAKAYVSEHNERAATDRAIERMRDSLKTLTPARVAAARASARADSVERTFSIHADTVPTVPYAVDTTRFALVTRVLAESSAPETYRVPQFVLDALMAERQAKDSVQNYAYLLETRLDQATHLAEERIRDERAASDSVEHAQRHEVVLADSLAEHTKPPRCSAKCGGIITITAIVVGKMVWSALAGVLEVRR